MANISDERIIAVLLTTDSKKEAIEILGIRRNTLMDRMKSPEFQKLYAEAKTELITGVINRCQSVMTEAIETIAEIMRDAENAPQIRLNAADSIMRHGIKLIETRDILERLETLETAFQNINTM